MDKDGATDKRKKQQDEEIQKRRPSRKASLPDTDDDEESAPSDSEGSKGAEEEDFDSGFESGDDPPRANSSKKSGSGDGSEKRRKLATPLTTLRKEQKEARGISAGADKSASPVVTDDADGRFERESPRTEGGVRTAAKYLVLATLHSNGKGATPYPSEKQYMGMIADYEGVPRWWDSSGRVEPTSLIQKKLLKNWPWIKACLSTTFTNTRARLKKETTRMFFTLYKIKQIQVDISVCGCKKSNYDIVLSYVPLMPGTMHIAK